MNIVLLSGGSGKRLWPLSNEARSKQFLRVLKNGNGESESMVQRVYNQICQSGIDSNIVVATSKSQKDSVLNHLGSAVDIVLEPKRRDTFPAIVLSIAHLFYNKGMQPNDAVIVMPVDPYTDLNYFRALIEMERLVVDGSANMVLMGVKPTYPSAKYGYILPAKDKNLVDRFHEKPPEEQAALLINDGALWNGGVFAFRLGYLVDIARKYIPFTTYEDVESNYQSLPKISFDYEVVEKEPSIAVVEYSGTWRDLGTWNTLTEVMDNNAIGKVIMADTCENTHVINELDIPVVVLGTRDMIVAASPDGILVSDKQQSSYLKPYVDSIEQRPMYEERFWGHYKVLEYNQFVDGMISLTRTISINANHELNYHSHQLRDEIWTIVDGTGDLVLDGEVRNIKRGDVAFIGKGQPHAIRAITDMRLIEVQIGAELTDADIEDFDS